MKVTFVLANEWQGLFVDGKLVSENSVIRAREALAALGITSETVYVDEEWFMNEDQLPKDLKDVKLSILPD